MRSLPPLPDVVVPRRTAVVGSVATGAALLGGCTPKGIDRRPRARRSVRPTPDEDPDVTLAATVLADEQRVLSLVDATLQQHPGLDTELAAVRSGHQRHVDLLTEAVPKERRSAIASPTEGSSPSVSPSLPPSPSASGSVPKQAGRALLALGREEDRLSLLGRRSAFSARSGAFARVLASMAAAAAQQSVTLVAAARERR